MIKHLPEVIEVICLLLGSHDQIVDADSNLACVAYAPQAYTRIGFLFFFVEFNSSAPSKSVLRVYSIRATVDS